MGETWLTGEDGERILTLHPYAEVYAPRWYSSDWTWYVHHNGNVKTTGYCDTREQAQNAAAAALRAYEEENQ
jgi:hypothetical protein